MIDLHAHFGRERRAVGYDALMRVLDADRVTVERGDFVCFYTGFADVILELKKNPDPKLLHETCTGLDGRDEKLLQWVSDCGCAALIADNYAVEIIPSEPVQADAACADAAARALHLQERHSPRRDLVPERARPLVARAQAQPLPADRPAA
jgi:hypothetical protein